ncbi:MAG: glycosyltransferase family 39 protein, partial [Chloroflexi bacterium]|nr:glycosyltransferase family 39 protein [Chloroflexota bacterium]
PAQMFSTLATWATVRAARRRALGWGVAAGAALGAAYLVRHTQLLMIAPMIAAARLFGPPRERWRWFLPAALAAAVLAVPDLWYHRIAFGSPFIPESEELANFALANVVPIARGLVVEFSRTNEYFYLLPFLAGGAWALWRSERPALALWVMWVATLILFHLPYSVLRLRGILSAMPAVAGVTAFGIVAWVRRWWPTNGRIGLAPALLIILPALALGARSRLTLRLPFGGQFSTFGYLNSDQRSAVEKMAQVVPPDGVIGSSLNSGAVDLYAGREAFRPAYWTETEFDKFLGAMDSAGRPVYLLGDGEEMDAPLDWARKRLCPTAIWNANLPFFSPDGQASDANVTLWQLTPSCAPASPSSFVSHSSLFPQEANLP